MKQVPHCGPKNVRPNPKIFFTVATCPRGLCTLVVDYYEIKLL